MKGKQKAQDHNWESDDQQKKGTKNKWPAESACFPIESDSGLTPVGYLPSSHLMKSCTNTQPVVFCIG